MNEKMTELLTQLFRFYQKMFEYDLEVFSQSWIYICLLIPAFMYLCIFLLKWTILTAPFWIPVRLAFEGIASIIKAIKE